MWFPWTGPLWTLQLFIFRKQGHRSVTASGILWKNLIGHYLFGPITVTLFFFPSSFGKCNETHMNCCKIATALFYKKLGTEWSGVFSACNTVNGTWWFHNDCVLKCSHRFHSVQFSRSVVSDSLWPHGLHWVYCLLLLMIVIYLWNNLPFRAVNVCLLVH